MRLYIGIAKAAVTLLLTATLAIGAASAIPLPSGPPEVDSTPESHVAEPEDFRKADESQELTLSASSIVEEEVPQTPNDRTSQLDQPPAVAGIDTGSIMLIGATIWYAITIIGVTGGRHGIKKRNN